MAETTANGTSTAMAQDYATSELSEVKADALLRDAERVVADIAPPPASVDADYTQAASDSELRVFEILATEKHRIKSESVDSISVSYADSSADIYNIVRDTMAQWLPAGASTDDGPGTVSFAEVPYWR